MMLSIYLQQRELKNFSQVLLVDRFDKLKVIGTHTASFNQSRLVTHNCSHVIVRWGEKVAC